MATPADRDFFQEAHDAAEKHLAICNAIEWEELDQEPEGFTQAGPYCGCETCMIRETLHAAWPLLREAALAGVE